ncbi:hypothetical protein pb186bvf_009662 [Paramecium bursaria]
MIINLILNSESYQFFINLNYKYDIQCQEFQFYDILILKQYYFISNIERG